MQYTPPGGPEAKPADREAALEQELEDARYHLGSVRIAPWFGVRDGAYVRNAFSTGSEPPDDFTVTVGAGVRGYLRNGPKVTWKAEVLPEYVYWQKQDQRRRVNGRYSLRAYGFFNRLTLEVGALRTQEQAILTPEVPIPATGRNDVQQLLAEVELTRLIRPFVLVTLTQARNLVDPDSDPRLDDLRTLDRDETVVRAGLRFQPGKDWRFGLGAERSQVDFERQDVDRSNDGTAPIVEARYEHNRLRIEADVAFRSLKARLDGELVPYEGPTGGFLASLRVARRTSLSAYGNRALVYSLSSNFSYIEDTRFGTGLTSELGSRTVVRLFYETGKNVYTPLRPGILGLTEDYENYGAKLTFQLSRDVSLGINALAANYDSGAPSGERTFRSVGATLNFGAR